tara:strand:+ start:38973 stop:39188 length:216 start_codon:yes stop_codon:yes gene_type:complete
VWFFLGAVRSGGYKGKVNPLSILIYFQFSLLIPGNLERLYFINQWSGCGGTGERGAGAGGRELEQSAPEKS